MFRRAVYALACVLALTLPVAAQEQTGQIQGTVKDTSGAVLPGVTVEANEPQHRCCPGHCRHRCQRLYRFVGLRPAKYDVTASCRASRRRRRRTLTFASARSCRSTWRSPSVASPRPCRSRRSRRSSTRSRARVKRPSRREARAAAEGRDFTTLVTQAPGANNEPRSAASRSMARARVKTGSSSTASRRPTSSQACRARTCIVTSSMSSRSSRAATRPNTAARPGGVDQRVTEADRTVPRLGRPHFQGDSLEARLPNTLRTNPSNSDAAEYRAPTPRTTNALGTRVHLGGPIVKDKLWFLAGFSRH